jgi:hypothetical protein
MNVTDDGYFGEELSEWAYEDGDKTIKYSITFKTDGTWEWKKMEEEFVDIDGDGKSGEGWIQTDGYKGTYSCDTEKHTFTVNNTTSYDTTNYEYNDAYDDDNLPGDILVSFTFPAYGGLTLNEEALDNDGGENDLLENASSADFESYSNAPGTSQYKAQDVSWRALLTSTAYFDGGSYVQESKVFDSGASTTWTGDDAYFFTNYRQWRIAFDAENNEYSRYSEEYHYDENNDSYTNHDTDNKIVYAYTHSPKYAIDSGNQITFSEVKKRVDYALDEFKKGSYTYVKDVSTVYSELNGDGDDDGNVDINIFGENGPDTLVDVSGDGDYLYY